MTLIRYAINSGTASLLATATNVAKTSTQESVARLFKWSIDWTKNTFPSHCYRKLFSFSNVYNMLPCRRMPQDINVNEAPHYKGEHQGAIQIARLATRQVPLLLRGSVSTIALFGCSYVEKKLAQKQVSQAWLPGTTWGNLSHVSISDLTNSGLVFLAIGQCFDKQGYPRMEIGSA